MSLVEFTKFILRAILVAFTKNKRFRLVILSETLFMGLYVSKSKSNKLRGK